MKLVPSRPVRRLLAGLTPIVLVAAALPLLAPTCGTFTPGVKTFSRNSLIIPMDVCYQCSTDGDTNNTAPNSCGVANYVTPTGPQFQGGIACPGATDAGDVIKAYGLVYQLIRNGIAVYWIIEPTKTKLDHEDFHVSYSGPPAFFYNWTNGTVSTTTVPATAASGTNTVAYRGGPFVIDGSDYAAASAILQQYKGTFGVVNVHVSNVAFQAPVARTMAGGWAAGGAIAPKLALLDIGSSGASKQNAEPVIRGYLFRAGLNTAGAGGTSAAGAHGEIYDRLTKADFIPTTGSDWTTTKLYQNGYQILWVPHWTAPSSCTDCTTGTSIDPTTGCPTSTNCTCANTFTAAEVTATLNTIGNFYASGHDVFAECAGLGSFEGVLSGTQPSTTVNTAYGSGVSSTHFQTDALGTPATAGVWISTSSHTPTSTIYQGGYASPFMQIGDFVFKAYSGAITTYEPTHYNSNVTRFLTDGSTSYTDYDVFTMVPGVTSGHGTSVYLGGHSYSGCGGTFQTAGTRLVLNSLFNLGASCVPSGISCSTGLLGVCGRGVMTCSGDTPVCQQLNFPTAETCDGQDNDCNGLVDDLPVQSCYDGPAATKNVGTCREGVRSCIQLQDGTYGYSACEGEVLPTTEVCNGLDDDCDGTADESLSQICYQGPAESISPTTGLPMGICKTGIQTCTNGNWSSCVGQVTPAAECCGTWDSGTRLCTGDISGAGNGIDENCNGLNDETCGCTDGNTQVCYTGPSGTAGVGPCHSGTQTCTGTSWGPCANQVVPVAEICGNGIDDDCNGTTDDPLICNVCPATPQSCYEGPAGTVNVGVCKAGQRTCVDGVFGTCGGVADGNVFTPQILPSIEVCDGKDNDCDGTADDGASCDPQGGVPYDCVNGFCVPGYCNPAEPAVIEGYTCDSGTDKYVKANCGTTGAPCAAGLQCVNGACVDPCSGLHCGAGSVCAGGQCTGGSCYSQGCDPGLICKSGQCITDPCFGEVCPSGTFCSEGDCVQSCVYVSCLVGQRCGADGFCVTDLCADVSCAAGKVCADGACVTNPCDQVSCGTGQYCESGICVDDPCSWITCPVGVCYRGQCYSVENPTGEGTIETPVEESSGGCGCSQGNGSSLALLFGLFGLPLARRRRVPRRGSSLMAVALALALTATLAGCPSDNKSGDTTPPVIDTNTDPLNCGQIGNACDTGEICVDGVCGPGSAVAPYITSISPAQAAKGTPTATVTLTGERFAGPVELRVIGPTSTTSIPGLTPTSSTSLSATIDISTAQAGLLYFRVVNADNVRSNAKGFDIILETPIVSSITPLTVPAGTSGQHLTVTGTGLNATSQCHVQGTNYADTALPTVQAGGGLDCTLDTSGMAPGNYSIWVRNEGNLNSAPAKTLVVVSNSSVELTSISPSAGAPGTIISMSAYGSGFDSSCKIWFDSAPQYATSFVDPTALFLAQLDLSPFTSGAHNVTVHCGTYTAGPVTFTISTGLPSLTGVSPQSAYQGETDKVITFTGTNFYSGAGLAAQIRKLDGTWVDFNGTAPATSFVSATSITGKLTLDPALWPEGEYQVRIKYPDNSLSGTYPFRILSNSPTLRTISPAGGAAGANLTRLDVTGSNFFAGIAFKLQTTAGVLITTIPVLGSPAMTQTTASIGPLSLAGRDTGQYQIVATNTGSAASNPLSFSVTPGVPTITTLSPASATQSDTPVTITLTGTNYAKPDASGNGGSQVVGWNTALGILDTAPIILPSTAVEVVNSTTITVTLDTRNLIPSATAYTVQVWNPGGTTPPQKSNTKPFTLNQ